MKNPTFQAVLLLVVLEGLLLWRGWQDPHWGFRAEMGFIAVLLALWFGVSLWDERRREL